MLKMPTNIIILYFMFFFFSFRELLLTRTFDYKNVVKSAFILPKYEKSPRRSIANRPALNLSLFSGELGVDRVNLYKIIPGLRNIPAAKRGQFLAVAQKYGYCPKPP